MWACRWSGPSREPQRKRETSSQEKTQSLGSMHVEKDLKKETCKGTSFWFPSLLLVVQKSPFYVEREDLYMWKEDHKKRPVQGPHDAVSLSCLSYTNKAVYVKNNFWNYIHTCKKRPTKRDLYRAPYFICLFLAGHIKRHPWPSPIEKPQVRIR